eukprot:Blabericola_migrator_1__2347@NODE_1655_length_4073_cov_26_750374_g806_i1_p1_GENE_NODE_1655_length_4073_cov_26_750374_g806_i1NODE_1655_length_4073_cov_26_750374_g806_i1_p1_ORF_typecomplete_len637_score72_95_NODE_1655_length_4073_cov_26_750374_g806_i12012111
MVKNNLRRQTVKKPKTSDASSRTEDGRRETSNRGPNETPRVTHRESRNEKEQRRARDTPSTTRRSDQSLSVRRRSPPPQDSRQRTRTSTPRNRPSGNKDLTNSPILAAAKIVEQRAASRASSRKRSSPEDGPESRGARSKKAARTEGIWDVLQPLASKGYDDLDIARTSAVTLRTTGGKLQFEAEMEDSSDSECAVTKIKTFLNPEGTMVKKMQGAQKQADRVLSSNTVCSILENLVRAGLPLQDATVLIRYYLRSRRLAPKVLLQRSRQILKYGCSTTESYLILGGATGDELARKLRKRLARQLRRGRELSPRSKAQVRGYEEASSPSSESTNARERRWLPNRQHREPLELQEFQFKQEEDESGARDPSVPNSTEDDMFDGDLEVLPSEEGEARSNADSAEEPEPREDMAESEEELGNQTVRSYQSTRASEMMGRRKTRTAPKARATPKRIATSRPSTERMTEMVREALQEIVPTETLRGLLRSLQDYNPHFEGDVPFYDARKGLPRPLNFATSVFPVRVLPIVHDDCYMEPSATHCSLRSTLPRMEDFLEDAAELLGYTNQGTSQWDLPARPHGSTRSVYFRTPPGDPRSDEYIMQKLVETMIHKQTPAVWFRVQTSAASPLPRQRLATYGTAI